MRVLYVNHTASVGGGEHSLLELIGGLPTAVHAAAACPPGPLADRLAALGVETHPIPELDGSLKLHPAYTPLTLARLGRSVREVARVASTGGFDVLHGNSIRAGIVAGLAARRSPAAAVGHIRDCLPPGRLSSVALGTVCRHCDAVIANSAYTARSLPAGSAPLVVHNPVDLARFDPRTVDRNAARAELGAGPGEVLLGMVAQITPWKAQDDAIRVTKLLAERGLPVRLALVGAPKFVSKATRFDNLEYVEGLRGLVGELEIASRVDFLGEREDVPAVLQALDVLLVPSWEEPFGRAVIEAMAMGTPVAATAVGGPTELLRNGVDGLLLAPCDPQGWADALEPLVLDSERRRRMGASARERAASRFGVPAHVERVATIYNELRGTAARRSGTSRLAA